MQHARPESGAPARPGTASRLAAQAGNAARPGTATRPGTGRTTAGNGRNRPRNNRDRPYFLAALRSKVTEVTNEINKLNSACKEFLTLEDFYATYRTEHATLSKAVGDLRASQYDYESMLEAVAKGITDDDIRAEIDSYKEQNTALTDEVQELLNQRHRKESDLKKLQDKAHKYESAGENLLKEMNSDDQNKYREMQSELELLNELEEKLINDYEQLKNNDRTKIEDELIFSPVKKDAAQALNRIRELQKTLDDVKMQISRTPEEEQAQLTEKLKNDNAEMASLQHQTETLETILNSLKKQLAGDAYVSSSGKVVNGNCEGAMLRCRKTLNHHLNAAVKEGDHQRFMVSFNEQVHSEQNLLGQSETDVQALLGRLSKNVVALNDLPIATEADILKSDQQFRSKIGQVRHQQQLREDLLQITFDENSRELRKLQLLFESLTREHEQSKTQSKRSSVPADLSDAREMIAKRQSELSAETKALSQNKANLAAQLPAIEKTLAQKSLELQKNSENIKIVNLETQLQKVEAKSFDLQEVIADLSATASYGDFKASVLRKVKELNKLLILLTATETDANSNE